MSRASGLPLARLRAIGCRVHSVIGHYPDAPGSHRNYHYGIVCPVEHLSRGIITIAEAVNAGADAAQDIREGRTDLVTRVEREHRGDGTRILVYVGHPREHLGPIDYKTDDAVVTEILNAIVVHLETHLVP